MTDISPPFLRVAAVSREFRLARALNDVTFEVAKGEFLSIIGPSGCGKSTLLKIMSGILSPSRGRVEFRGKSIDQLPPAEHGVLMVWQSLALFPHLDVGDNVGFGLAVRKVDAAERNRRVAEALQLVQLSGFERRDVGTLSGGEQQRVALARALVLDPAVLLLDEPVQGLDRRLRSQLIGTLRQLHHRLKVTMVMVTHEQDEALLISTRIAVMQRGQIEQIDTPDALLRRPATKFVAEFVGDRNIFPGRVIEIRQNLVTVETTAGTLEGMLPSWLAFVPTRGEEVAYVIDAHQVELGDGAGKNAIDAIVEAVVENGISESIEFAGPDVSVIKCLRPARPSSIVPPIGSKVTLSWDSADAFVLPGT